MKSHTIEIQLSGCAIILNDKLLLLKKFKNPYYEFPGGKVDPGEDVLHAAVREVKEEVGCTVNIIENFGFFDFIHHSGKNARSNIFIAEAINNPIIVETDVFEDMIWMPLDKYTDYKLAPNVEYFCKKYKNQ